MSDLFGFEKAIQLDHLTDKQINELEKILKDYQQIAACRLDKIKLARKRAGLSTGLRELSTTPGI